MKAGMQGTGVGFSSSQSHEVMDGFALLKRRMALTWLCFNVVVVCSSLRCILSSKISTPSDSS